MQHAPFPLATGDDLEHCNNVQPGDFIYIPANGLHAAVNRGIKSTAQESLVLRPEMDAQVP